MPPITDEDARKIRAMVRGECGTNPLDRHPMTVEFDIMLSDYLKMHRLLGDAWGAAGFSDVDPVVGVGGGRVEVTIASVILERSHSMRQMAERCTKAEERDQKARAEAQDLRIALEEAKDRVTAAEAKQRAAEDELAAYVGGDTAWCTPERRAEWAALPPPYTERGEDGLQRSLGPSNDGIPKNHRDPVQQEIMAAGYAEIAAQDADFDAMPDAMISVEAEGYMDAALGATTTYYRAAGWLAHEIIFHDDGQDPAPLSDRDTWLDEELPF